MIILPSAYFGSTEYWTAIRKGGDDVVIDLGENYVKRCVGLPGQTLQIKDRIIFRYYNILRLST